MTHAELVERAAKWLRARGCQTTVTRASVMTMEQPDAIGWNAGGFSRLVECKASRADFLRDRKKWHRRFGVGMGYWRYYLTPDELVRPDELPAGWGLLYCRGKRLFVAKEPVAFTDWNRHEELKHLLADCRRRDGVVKALAPKPHTHQPAGA